MAAGIDWAGTETMPTRSEASWHTKSRMRLKIDIYWDSMDNIGVQMGGGCQSGQTYHERVEVKPGRARHGVPCGRKDGFKRLYGLQYFNVEM